MKELNPTQKQEVNQERREILEQLEDWLETPMLVLGFIWLALLVNELVRGLSPLLEIIGTVIWIIFILDFLLKFILAPDKTDYIKHNITASLASFFIGRDAGDEQAEVAGTKSIQELKGEIASLRAEIRTLIRQKVEQQ